MRAALTIGLALVAALALVGKVAAAEPVAPGPDAVYVSDNSEYYHRADCRRLHFATAVSLAAAAAHHRPCPVCHPPGAGEAPVASPAPVPLPVSATATTPAQVAAAPAAETAAATPGATRESKPHRPGKYRWLGLGIGAGLGFLIGAAIDFDQCFLQSCNSGKEAALVIGFAAAGGLAGYSVAGGFSHRSDEALERGREAIRQAGAASSGIKPTWRSPTRSSQEPASP